MNKMVLATLVLFFAVSLHAQTSTGGGNNGGGGGPLKLVNTHLGSAHLGEWYESPSLTGSGGTQPYFWSVDIFQESWLSLNVNSAGNSVLAGFPQVPDSSSSPYTVLVMVTITDSSSPQESVSKLLSVLVVEPLHVTHAPAMNSAYKTGSEIGPIVFSAASTWSEIFSNSHSWTASGLPDGIRFGMTWISDGQGGGALQPALSGTVATTAVRSEPYNIVVTATNTTGANTGGYGGTHGSEEIVVSIVPPLEPPDISLPSALEGEYYESSPFEISNGIAPLQFSLAGGPSGLGVEPRDENGFAFAGEVAIGTGSNMPYAMTLTVQDSANPPDVVSLSVELIVYERLMILSGALPSARVADAYSAPLSVTRSEGPLEWSLEDAPSSFDIVLDVSSNVWVVRGTPVVEDVGVHLVWIRVQDLSLRWPQSDETRLVFVVSEADGAAPFSLITSELPAGEQYESYGPVSVSVQGGTPSYVWQFDGLPPGITATADAGNVFLSGITEQSGLFYVRVVVSDASNPVQYAQGVYPLVIRESSALDVPTERQEINTSELLSSSVAGCALSSSRPMGDAALRLWLLCLIALGLNTLWMRLMVKQRAVVASLVKNLTCIVAVLVIGGLSLYGITTVTFAETKEGGSGVSGSDAATDPQLLRSNSEGVDAPSGRLILRVPAQGEKQSLLNEPPVEESGPPAEPTDDRHYEGEGAPPTFFGEQVGGTGVFVIDVSVSMGAKDIAEAGEDWDGNIDGNMSRLNAVKYELVNMLRGFDRSNRFDIVWLAGIDSGGPTPGMPVTDVWRGELTQATDENIESAIQAIKDQQTWWGTPTYRSLERATHDYGEEIDTLAFLSDGAPFPPDHGYWGKNHKVAIFEKFPNWYAPLKAHGCNLIVVHVGKNASAGSFMEDFAAQNDAKYTHK